MCGAAPPPLLGREIEHMDTVTRVWTCTNTRDKRLIFVPSVRKHMQEIPPRGEGGANQSFLFSVSVAALLINHFGIDWYSGGS